MSRFYIGPTLPRTLLLISLLGALLPAQDSSRGSDELQRVSDVIDRAWSEVKQFRVAVRKNSAITHPGVHWSGRLWQYRNDHPHTPAASKAAVAALNLLLDAGHVETVMTMVETVPADDPAWDRIIQVLWRDAEKREDYSRFITKAEAVLRGSPNKQARTRAGIFLGQAYWKQDQIAQAKAVFEAVLAEAPDSEDGKWAKGNIYEMTHLALGKSAPPFNAATIDGRPFSSAAFQGRIALIYFWATW